MTLSLTSLVSFSLQYGNISIAEFLNYWLLNFKQSALIFFCRGLVKINFLEEYKHADFEFTHLLWRKIFHNVWIETYIKFSTQWPLVCMCVYICNMSLKKKNSKRQAHIGEFVFWAWPSLALCLTSVPRALFPHIPQVPGKYSLRAHIFINIHKVNFLYLYFTVRIIYLLLGLGDKCIALVINTIA